MAITEEHSRSRRKHSHGEQTTVSIDRISDLPDAVLCHILSFLETKFSVRTSILARRWRYLWAYVPNLVFTTRESQEIINSVLLLRRVQTIHTFSLYYGLEFSDYQLQTWVTSAIVRNVQKLDLFFRSQFTLPRCLFTCTTLVSLGLHSLVVIPVCSPMSLPRLKKLHLFRVRFEADESLPHLLSACPVLEVLTIKLSAGMVYCNISSPTIKKLILKFTSKRTGGRYDRLEINTPALVSLYLSDSFSEHIKCGVLNSLIEANINLVNDENKPDYFLYSRSLMEFIEKFCNVKLLKLNLSYCPKIIDSVVYAWTTRFRNLTKLQLTGDIRSLPMFLKNSDNLEILVLSEFGEEIEGWMEPLQQQVPPHAYYHI